MLLSCGVKRTKWGNPTKETKIVGSVAEKRHASEYCRAEAVVPAGRWAKLEGMKINAGTLQEINLPKPVGLERFIRYTLQ
jgi:hypothetical protein